MMYPCTKCGSCCKRVDVAVASTMNDERFFFPYKWDETGRCEKLNDDNTCQVYENRPLLCNIDRIIETLGLDKEEVYRKNIKACNIIMDEDNVPISLRIKN